MSADILEDSLRLKDIYMLECNKEKKRTKKKKEKKSFSQTIRQNSKGGRKSQKQIYD